MNRVDVNWFEYDESNNRLESLKYNIAVSCESALNGFYDEAMGEDAWSREEWFEYIRLNVLSEFTQGGWSVQSNVNRFAGSDKIDKYINIFLDNYADVQPYIKGE